MRCSHRSSYSPGKPPDGLGRCSEEKGASGAPRLRAGPVNPLKKSKLQNRIIAIPTVQMGTPRQGQGPGPLYPNMQKAVRKAEFRSK